MTNNNAKSGSTSRDVIFTIQHKGGYADLAPFVQSLKRTGYCGRLVVFASQVDRDTEAALRRQKVEFIPFHFSGKRDRQRLARLWPLWRWYFASRASHQAKRRLAYKVFHLRYLRYLIYGDYLQAHRNDFDRVLLVDGRDVFFQLDPFSWNPPAGLHCVLEENSVRIGHCRLHQMWMGCQFGEDYVRKHSERVVSCSGTTFGDPASICQYLDQMVAVFMRARNLAKISGGDQGVHNYVLIENLLPNVMIYPNRQAPVLTMGVMKPEDIHFNTQGQALNADGMPAPVLHQYDRLPDLKARLMKILQTE